MRGNNNNNRRGLREGFCWRTVERRHGRDGRFELFLKRNVEDVRVCVGR